MADNKIILSDEVEIKLLKQKLQKHNIVNISSYLEEYMASPEYSGNNFIGYASLTMKNVGMFVYFKLKTNNDGHPNKLIVHNDTILMYERNLDILKIYKRITDGNNCVICYETILDRPHCSCNKCSTIFCNSCIEKYIDSCRTIKLKNVLSGHKYDPDTHCPTCQNKPFTVNRSRSIPIAKNIQ